MFFMICANLFLYISRNYYLVLVTKLTTLMQATTRIYWWVTLMSNGRIRNPGQNALYNFVDKLVILKQSGLVTYRSISHDCTSLILGILPFLTSILYLCLEKTSRALFFRKNSTGNDVYRAKKYFLCFLTF